MGITTRAAKRKAATLHREMFETSRDSKYLTIRDLQAKTGQPSSLFAAVVVKEANDNVLDTAESAERDCDHIFDKILEELHISGKDGGIDAIPACHFSVVRTKVLQAPLRTTEAVAAVL
jgi:hypothetical protein